jgi:DNA adenine methylase
MLSNNDVELVYELYNGFNIEIVSAKRMINSKADKRTGQEVIITNY